MFLEINMDYFDYITLGIITVGVCVVAYFIWEYSDNDDNFKP